jgi:hypothetical protein
VIVVDDHTLLAVLAKSADPDLQRSADENEIFTTGSWYYRLARAVRDRQFSGSLSRQLQSLPADVHRLVVTSLEDLPQQIGLQSPRVLVPVMASLSAGIRRLNHLNAEALASALVLQAELRVGVASDVLRSASSTLGIALRVAPI